MEREDNDTHIVHKQFDSTFEHESLIENSASVCFSSTTYDKQENLAFSSKIFSYINAPLRNLLLIWLIISTILIIVEVYTDVNEIDEFLIGGIASTLGTTYILICIYNEPKEDRRVSHLFMYYLID